MLTETLGFSKIKRQVYRIALPFLTLSVLLTYLLSLNRVQSSSFNNTVLPYLAASLAIAAIAVFYVKVKLELVEVGLYAILAFVLVAKFSYSLVASYTMVSGQSELVQIYIWTTVNFVLAYFLFSPRVAVIGTSCVYACTVVAGIVVAFIFSEGALTFPDRLFEFYLANAVELSLLYGLSNIHSRIAALRAQLSQMEELAFVDMLTGIANRRQIEISLQKELSSAERYGTPLSIILFDVDHFKSVNDRYGHDKGDYVLRSIAQLFSDYLRDTDWIGRWGGEEFLIISPQTPLSGALLLAERLRVLLAKHSFETVGQITASFGVSSYEANDSLKRLNKRADEALYLAKDHGRNRVEAVKNRFIEHVSIGELYSPFPIPKDTFEARAKQLNRNTIAWLHPLELASKQKLYKLVSAINPGWLAVNLHSSASAPVLQCISDWYCWMFLLDDRCDESSLGQDPERLSELHNALIVILKGENPPVESMALSKLLFDLGRRLRAQSSKAWFDQFLVQVDHYFQATVWEARNRARAKIPSVASYLSMRPAASGVAIDLCFIELADGLSLDTELYEQEEVQALISVANLIICYANDLYSLNKEIHHHDIHNLVLSLQEEHALSLQDALQKALAMHDCLVRRFEQRNTYLATFGQPQQSQLKDYFDLLEKRISCNLIWSRGAARYQPSELVRVESAAFTEPETLAA